MATLSGNKVKDTYTSLLKLDSNGVTSSLKVVEDGAGTDSALKLSTDTVEVDGILSFTTAPTTDSSELTVLLVDASNNVVKRELDTSAFSAASVQSFANPMFVLRPSASYTLTTTLDTPSQGAVNNNSVSGSYLFNDSSNAHLQTSSTTTGAMTIVRNGAIRIDVNLMLEVTTANTDIIINVMRKPSGGAAAIIQSIVRSKAATGNMAIGFSLFTHCADADDIYYELKMNSGGGAAMTTQSTFAVTKLD